MFLNFLESSYIDAENSNINKTALKICVVFWKNSDIIYMSINLRLWFIHLLVTFDISVKKWYSTLETWQKLKNNSNHNYYCQTNLFRILTLLSQERILTDSASTSWDETYQAEHYHDSAEHTKFLQQFQALILNMHFTDFFCSFCEINTSNIFNIHFNIC